MDSSSCSSLTFIGTADAEKHSSMFSSSSSSSLSFFFFVSIPLLVTKHTKSGRKDIFVSEAFDYPDSILHPYEMATPRGCLIIWRKGRKKKIFFTGRELKEQNLKYSIVKNEQIETALLGIFYTKIHFLQSTKKTVVTDWLPLTPSDITIIYTGKMKGIPCKSKLCLRELVLIDWRNS